PRSFLV
nr:Chain C, PEPTIDE [Homo sapiens]